MDTGESVRRRALLREISEVENRSMWSAQGQFEQAKGWQSFNLWLGSLAAGCAAVSGALVLSTTGLDIFGRGRRTWAEGRPAGSDHRSCEGQARQGPQSTGSRSGRHREDHRCQPGNGVPLSEHVTASGYHFLSMNKRSAAQGHLQCPSLGGCTRTVAEASAPSATARVGSVAPSKPASSSADRPARWAELMDWPLAMDA